MKKTIDFGIWLAAIVALPLFPLVAVAMPFYDRALGYSWSESLANLGRLPGMFGSVCSVACGRA